MTGTFNYEGRARQLIRFDEMNVGRRGFTDLDAVMEWRNLGWLVFEVKRSGKDVPLGQRIALERFVHDVAVAGKYGVAAIVEHTVLNPQDDIYLRDCIVRDLYVTGEYVWRPPKHWMNAQELMRDFIGYIDKSNEGGGPVGSPPFYWR